MPLWTYQGPEFRRRLPPPTCRNQSDLPKLPPCRGPVLKEWEENASPIRHCTPIPFPPKTSGSFYNRITKIGSSGGY